MGKNKCCTWETIEWESFSNNMPFFQYGDGTVYRAGMCTVCKQRYNEVYEKVGIFTGDIHHDEVDLTE